MEVDFIYKVTFIGDSGVGKTALLQNLAPVSFSKSYRYTTGVELHTLPLSYEDMSGRAQMYEVGGIPRFERLTTIHTQGTNLLILIYDVTKPETLDSIKNIWNKLVDGERVFRRILVGTHKDLKSQQTVSKKEGDRVAKELGCSHHIHTNATRYDVDLENLLVASLYDIYYSNHPRKTIPQYHKIGKSLTNVLGITSAFVLLLALFNQITPIFIENDMYTLIVIFCMMFFSLFISFNYLENSFAKIRIPTTRRKLGVTFSKLKTVPKLKSKYYETFHYYERIPLEVLQTRTGLNRLKWVIGAVGTIEITTILTIAFWEANIGDPQILEFLLSIGTISLFIILTLIIIVLMWLITRKEIIKETKNLFTGRVSILSLIFTFLGFITINFIGWNRGWSSLEGMLLATVIMIPLFLVSRIEGKFFVMFAIQQFFQAQNWDFLEGDGIHPIYTRSDRLKGLILRIYSLITLILIPLSIIGLLTNYWSVIVQNNPLTDSSILEGFFFFIPLEIVPLVIFVLGIGPLLMLLIKPMNFVENWVNQGLYDKIGSTWKTSRLDSKKQDKEVIQFPNLSNAFTMNLILVTSMILVNVGLISISEAISTLFPILSEAVLIANVSTSFAFLFTFCESFFSLTEERNMIHFAKIGKKDSRDVINEILWGENSLLSEEKYKLEKWLSTTPKTWGTPSYLQGLALFYNIWEKVDSLSVSKNEILSFSEEANIDEMVRNCLSHFDNALDPSTSLLPELIPQALTKYAQLHFVIGKNIRAMEFLQKSLEIQKDNDEAWLNYWKAYVLQRDENKALMIYNKHIKTRHDSYYAWFGIGNILVLQSKNKEAKGSYERSIEIKSDFPDVWFNYMRLTAYAGELTPETIQKVISFLTSSNRDVRLKSLETVNKIPDELIRIEPVRSGIMLSTSDTDEKIRFLALRVMEKWPETLNGELKIREVILTRLKDTNSEIKEKALDLTCLWNDSLRWQEDIRNSVVKLLFSDISQKGEDSKSFKILENSLEKKPDSYTTLFFLAYGAILQNQHEVAFNHIKKALRLNKEIRNVIENDPIFRSILEDPRYSTIL
jgi:Ras-related protein Rab-18